MNIRARKEKIWNRTTNLHHAHEMTLSITWVASSYFSSQAQRLKYQKYCKIKSQEPNVAPIESFLRIASGIGGGHENAKR
jgi:hypothetical protein